MSLKMAPMVALWHVYAYVYIHTNIYIIFLKNFGPREIAEWLRTLAAFAEI